MKWGPNVAEIITRRQFLIAAGVVAGGAIAFDLSRGVSGLGETDEPVATPTRTYEGDGAMGKRVLVGYATRTGSTVGVAEAIAETLGERGFTVDLKALKERPALDGYDAVVLGSAVNGGQWLPEALRFAESNSAALRSIPTAIFSVHIMNLGADDKARAKRRAYHDAVQRLVTPSDEGFFAGKGPTADDTSLIARWAFKAFGGGGEGDCRNWNAIRAWAHNTTI
jgi:menaquinone-dependent protoporphyrinogen oxidase